MMVRKIIWLVFGGKIISYARIDRQLYSYRVVASYNNGYVATIILVCSGYINVWYLLLYIVAKAIIVV